MQIEGITLMVLFYRFFSVHVFRRLPCVVCRWIAFPFDQVLELTPTPVMSVIDHRFDFILFLILNQIRWWTLKVGTMDSRFFVGQ